MNKESLQRFCADASDIRYYLCQPWSRGEWTYATNGHIIVRVKRLAEVEENDKAPDCETMIRKQAAPTNWMPVPVATMPPDVVCYECNGSGCYTDGDENEDCDWCNRTGKVKQRIGMTVGNASYDQGYLSMIQGWKISPAGPTEAAWIRNGEAVDGLLMPRKG